MKCCDEIWTTGFWSTAVLSDLEKINDPNILTPTYYE